MLFPPLLGLQRQIDQRTCPAVWRVEKRHLKVVLIDQRHPALEIADANVILLKLLVRLGELLEHLVAVSSSVVA